MAFDSAAFLFFFFPVVFLCYRLIRGQLARRIVLLCAGLVFYAFGQLPGLILLVLSALVNYLFGLALMRWRVHGLVVVAVVLNLLFLGSYKYLNFFLESVNLAFGSSLAMTGLLAPAGISFFTFKGISYVIDVSRNPALGSRNGLDVLLYISFFPQVMAGPIARFEDFAPQLLQRDDSAAFAARGVRRLVVGLAKKLIFAAGAGRIADAVFALEAGVLDVRLAWLGALAYMVQIYFDFSGYSDMAIGLGQAFGFTTAENFTWPYAAGSLTDFWRRWHISLSRWFRDYLYIPLGGNRRGRARTALNKAIVFTLCGLWHGANWTFVIWGFWHGLFSALESLRVIDVKRLQRSVPGRVVSHVYALLVVCLGFVMFRADTVSGAFTMLGAMFGSSPVTAAGTLQLQQLLSGWNVAILLMGMVLSLPVGPALRRRLSDGAGVLRRGADAAAYCGSAVLFVLCLLSLSVGGFSPFIYFQF